MPVFVITGVVTAVLSLLLVVASSGRASVSPGDPGHLVYSAPRGYSVASFVCAGVYAAGFLALALGIWGRGGQSLDLLFPALLLLALAGLAVAAGVYYARWGLVVDGEGVHLSRSFLPDRDVAWGDVDAVAFERGARSPEFDRWTFMSGGRRALSFRRQMLGGRLSRDDQLSLAIEAHGLAERNPLDLSPGLSPWGSLRRRYATAPSWRRGLAPLAFAIVVVALALAFVCGAVECARAGSGYRGVPARATSALVGGTPTTGADGAPDASAGCFAARRGLLIEEMGARVPRDPWCQVVRMPFLTGRLFPLASGSRLP